QGVLQSALPRCFPHGNRPLSLPLGMLQDTSTGTADLGSCQVTCGCDYLVKVHGGFFQAAFQVTQVAPLTLRRATVEKHDTLLFAEALCQTVQITATILIRHQGEP